MATVATGSIVHATDNQLTCEIDGSSVILSVGDGVYYGLDPVGTFIWNRLKEPVSVETLRDAVVQHFDVEAPRCEADIIALLNDLHARQLVVIDAP